MVPSKNLNSARNWLIISSEIPRTPSDLLHRALAHVSHKDFNIHRLTIFEDPAIAVLNVFPKSFDCEKLSNRLNFLKASFKKKNIGVSISVKVIAANQTKRKFFVRYVMEQSSVSKRKKQQNQNDYPDRLERLVEDMFCAIPDISSERPETAYSET